MTLAQDALIFGAAFVAGAVNAVAGGGTLLSFPALLSVGVPSTIANATNSTALAPGSFASFWGYRKELADIRHLLVPLAVLATLGATLGALLLLWTPTKVFDRIVPVLILSATLVFAFQEKLKHLAPAQVREGAGERLTVGVMIFLFLIAVYGGYFGAGIGILTLAALGILGMTDLHRMNGIKALFAGAINLVAAVTLLLKGKVDLPAAAIMAVGAILGGFLGAGGARRVGTATIRRVVIGIGIALFAQTVWRFYF